MKNIPDGPAEYGHPVSDGQVEPRIAPDIPRSPVTAVDTRGNDSPVLSGPGAANAKRDDAFRGEPVVRRVGMAAVASVDYVDTAALGRVATLPPGEERLGASSTAKSEPAGDNDVHWLPDAGQGPAGATDANHMKASAVSSVAKTAEGAGADPEPRDDSEPGEQGLNVSSDHPEGVLDSTAAEGQAPDAVDPTAPDEDMSADSADRGGSKPPIDTGHNTASGSPEDSEPVHHYAVTSSRDLLPEDAVIISSVSPLAGMNLEAVATGEEAPDVDVVYPRQIEIRSLETGRTALRARTEHGPETEPGVPDVNAPPTRLVIDELSAPLSAIGGLVEVALDAYVQDATQRLTEPVPGSSGRLQFTAAARAAGLPEGDFSRSDLDTVLIGQPETGLTEVVLADTMSGNAARAGRVANNLVAGTVVGALEAHGLNTASINAVTTGDSPTPNAISVRFQPVQPEAPSEPRTTRPLQVADIPVRWKPHEVPSVLSQLGKMVQSGAVEIGPNDIPERHKSLRGAVSTILNPDLTDAEMMRQLNIGPADLDSVRIHMVRALQANPRLARLELDLSQIERPVDAPTVGAQLRAWAAGANMSQQQLSTTSGVPQTTISRLFNDRTHPDPGVVEQVMRSLQMPPAIIAQLLAEYNQQDEPS